MLSLGYRYVYAIVMSIAGLALCLRVSENAALCLGRTENAAALRTKAPPTLQSNEVAPTDCDA